MGLLASLWRAREAPHHMMTVVGSEPIGTHIHHVTLALPPGETETFEVGSYIQPNFAYSMTRAYSIAEASNTACSIIVSSSGRGVGARFFSQIKVGASFKVYGPFSDFPFHPGTGRPKLFLATGTGVAPFLRMVPTALNERLPAMLLLGGPQEEDLPFHDYFLSLAQSAPQFTYMPVLSRGPETWPGARGFITHHMEEVPFALPEADIYICGVPMMVQDVQALLKRLGVPKKQVFLQKFG